MYVSGSDDVTVGGADAGEGNVIDANSSGGVIVDGNSTHATIAGNSIGAEHLGNGVAGVLLQSADGTSHSIGGTAPGAGNTIAFNNGPGVQTSSSAVSVSVRRNAIDSNSGLGIDLKADGVTANDDPDADGLQNAPDLTAATVGGGQVTVRGELRSKPGETYSVELFAGRACAPSGRGQGHDYLATVSVTTDSSGVGSFTQSAASSASAGDVVTATATDPDGKTSEFSGCQTVAAVPALSAGNVTVGESDGSAVVPVTLSDSSARTITVSYATADDSAQAGSDYESSSGTLTFAPGETTKDVHVPISDDSLNEPDEKFTLELSNPVEATVDHGTGVVTIADDDAAPSVSIADTSVAEGSGGTTNATFPVTLSAPSGKTVTVDAHTVDGSATAPDDYSARNVTLTFAPGETSKDVTVPIVADYASEADETFQVALGSEANASVARREATGTVRNDDDVPGISVGDVRVVEATGSAVNADFTVSLSRASGSTTSVHLTTADGSATAGSDYSAVDTTVTFAPGQTAQTVPVPVTGDAVHEPDETFTARLSQPVSGVVARGEATATIVDDDQPAPSAPQEPQPQPQPEPQPQPQRDNVAPRLTLGLPRKVSRAALLRKGLKVGVTPNEPVTLDVQLLAPRRFLHGARSADVLLGQAKLALASGKRTVKLKVLPKLRRRLTRHPAQLRVRVLATDGTGNQTRVTKAVTVR